MTTTEVTLNLGESVMIGNYSVMLIRVNGQDGDELRCRLGVDAPRGVPVNRGEIQALVVAERQGEKS